MNKSQQIKDYEQQVYVLCDKIERLTQANKSLLAIAKLQLSIMKNNTDIAVAYRNTIARHQSALATVETTEVL